MSRFAIPFYPDVLILEYGADRPGDIKYLMSFVKLKIGVVTNVSEAHLEFFETVEKISQEKGKEKNKKKKIILS